MSLCSQACDRRDWSACFVQIKGRGGGRGGEVGEGVGGGGGEGGEGEVVG